MHIIYVIHKITITYLHTNLCIIFSEELEDFYSSNPSFVIYNQMQSCTCYITKTIFWSKPFTPLKIFWKFHYTPFVCFFPYIWFMSEVLLETNFFFIFYLICNDMHSHSIYTYIYTFLRKLIVKSHIVSVIISPTPVIVAACPESVK